MENHLTFFKSKEAQELLIGTLERIDLIKKIPDLKEKLESVEGVNLFSKWDELFANFTQLWQKDMDKNPVFFKIDDITLNKLAFYLDFVAQFFLNNGSAEDTDYLKNVSRFFEQYNIKHGPMETETLFKKAFL